MTASRMPSRSGSKAPVFGSPAGCHAPECKRSPTARPVEEATVTWMSMFCGWHPDAWPHDANGSHAIGRLLHAALLKVSISRDFQHSQ